MNWAVFLYLCDDKPQVYTMRRIRPFSVMRQKSRYFLITIILLSALIFSLYIWTYEASPQSTELELKMDYTVSEADIDDLTNLLQQKIKDLHDANMWIGIGEQRLCTSSEKENSRCIEPNCSDVMASATSPQNIQSIRKAVRGVGLDTMRKVTEAFDVKPVKTKYLFLTAVSSNHFEESRIAIESLRNNVLPYISNYSIIYYDLGLTRTQRNHVSSTFKAHLRDFPFDKLPARIRYLQCYIWKPLLILAHMNHSEITVWFDSSIHFLKDMRPLFSWARKTGFLVRNNGHPFAQHVYLKMFTYFGDKPCQFSLYEEIDAGFAIYHNEPFTRRLLVEPWSACAVDPYCMCPAETMNVDVLMCPNGRRYGKCHRYDQATIGYILIKLFRKFVPSIFLEDIYHKVVQNSGGGGGRFLFNILAKIGIL